MNKIAKYLFLKVLFLIASIFVSATIIFILPRLVPSNPLIIKVMTIQRRLESNPEAVEAALKSLYEYFEFNKPLHEQYISFLAKVFRGDLGTSISMFPLKTTEIIGRALPWTLALLFPATLLAWFIGNTLGAVAGYRRGSIFEKISMVISLILSQAPYYWIAMLLIYLFVIKYSIFPLAGAYSETLIPSLTPKFILDVLWHYTLPFLSLLITGIGWWAISMRALIIYELESDYIRFSRSLGVKTRKLFMYAFRNSMLPQVTNLAINLGYNFAGALLTEVVFSYPGVGWYLYSAISSLDYPVIQGLFLIVIIALFLAVFIVDFIYALLDPRIRLGYSEV